MAALNRVVITGFGIVAPNGIGLDAFWQTLLDGRSGIGPITVFDASDLPIRFAGEVRNFSLSDFLNGHFNPRRIGRHTGFALAAAQMALQHAGITRELLAREAPVSIVMGVSSSSIELIEQAKHRLDRHGARRVSPYGVVASQPHAITSAIGTLLGVPTSGSTASNACAAGLEAVALGTDLIRRGKKELVISGGADSPLARATVASFASAGLQPPSTGDPATVSRPFDFRRTGGIMAEGSGVVILESLAHALARGALPLLEVLGFGNVTDEPGSQPGSGMKGAMALALANSGRRPDEVQYVCAHGPSDPILDMVETEAIRQVFGSHAYRIPVSSIKGVTGNPLSAAGPFQLAATAMAIRTGRVPPTANYEEPDPQCDLDYVPNIYRHATVDCALVNVHGLGGCNCSILVDAVSGS